MGNNKQKSILHLEQIIKRFYIGKPNELQILNGIDLDVYPGEFVSIVGQSGSGKTTLMNVIGLLDRPTEGTRKSALYFRRIIWYPKRTP